MRTIKNLRWWIAGLLALVTALNYLDRHSFPNVVGEVKKEIPIDDVQYGQLTAIFFLAYAIMYAGGGRIMDWLGTRRGYALMIGWWSVANALMGTISSVLGLGVCRFLLGMGEGGGFPGSAKAVAEWFRPRERAMAFGLFNTGSAVGAVIAPPLLALIAYGLGWRWVFYITGAFGLVRAWVWLRSYRPPASHPNITDEERQLTETAQAQERSAQAEAGPPMRWLEFFRIREVRGMMLAKFLSDAAWFSLTSWMPKYLGDEHGLDIRKIGYFAWIPWVFAGVGSLTAGLASNWLQRGSRSIDRSRKIILGISAMLLPVSMLIVTSPLGYVIVLFSTVYLGHQCFASIMQTLPADLFSSRNVGSVAGLLGAAGSFGAMLLNLLVGWIVQHHGYAPAFVITGLLHPIAFLVILRSVRRIEPLALPKPG